MGVAVFGLVADSAHDVGLTALLINGVAHGFAVDRKTLVLFAIGFVPALQGRVDLPWVDTDQDISYDVLAGHDIAAMFTATPETFTCLLTEAVGPILYGPVTSHAAKNCSGCNGQDGGDTMSTTLNVGQGSHLHISHCQVCRCDPCHLL